MTWTLVKRDIPVGWPPVFLQFTDSQYGFASQGVLGTPGLGLLVTSDGGLTWTVVQMQVS